jgi:3-dehydroquinate synthase
MFFSAFSAVSLVNDLMEKINVQLSERSYPILIGSDILTRLGEELKLLGLGSRIAVITNSVVRPLYGGLVEKTLQESGFQVKLIEVPDGEVYKSLATAEGLYDELVDFAMDRTSTVMALGGGVIGDLAGFVAATYMRGVCFVNIPTTLLAHVDSAVGGKTGVDHPRGKNLIGAFHQPSLVLCDLSLLKTLPEKELLAGMAEVVKYGVILDPDFFSFVESHVPQILKQDSRTMTEVVRSSCAAKASVVEDDEREAGRRAILNFGHTLGHAIESLTGYTRYIHGEAVSMGMTAAARISHAMGLCDKEVVSRLEKLLKRIGLPTDLPEINPEEVIRILAHDKKVRDGKVRFVLPQRIGKVVIRDDVDPEIIRSIIKS